MQAERHRRLLDYLETSKSASVKQLAEALFTSESSVRRDLAALEKAGLIQRVWGGVILSKYQNSVVPLALRESANSGEKEQIAASAAALVPENATILLDASSTTHRMLRYLGHLRNLTIITNDARTFADAESIPNARIYSTGGIYDRKNHAFVGAAAENYLRTVHADFLFFSSQGISEDGEISDASEEETALRRVMLERARERVFLCDSSKLGIRRTFRLCSREDVSRIVCTCPLPWET
jgi:DeoR/GlpR family transcriptional regulator of sugar metabolism